MHLSLFLILLSFSSFIKADITKTGCSSFALSHDDNDQSYVICKGNFTEMENLKLELQAIRSPIVVFELQDVLIDVLPSDVFHDVAKPEVRKVIFDNVTLELLEVPELGDPPLKSIKDTVESLEIYRSSTVFAWKFASLSFENLKNFIIEDSELISITTPFFFLPELQFVQFQNSNLKWVHPVAFKGNRKLVICSLARNRILQLSRSMFPKPATELYSLDFSFNRLEDLPHDMFTEMDMLRELKLDNNRLKFISLQHFQTVWDNLTQMWLDENDIQCDALCWMTRNTEKPLFLESSKCNSPGKFEFISMYLEKCPKDIIPT